MMRMKKSDSVFQERMAKHQDELRWLYMELYGNEEMFGELTSQMYELSGEKGKSEKPG